MRARLSACLLPVAALVLGFAAPAFAQDAAVSGPALVATVPAPPAIIAHPAIWQVKDRDTTIYLFGTVHLLKPGTEWFRGAVRKAFDKSDEIVLEIVDDEDPGVIVRTVQSAMDLKGPSLPSQLSDDVRARYLAALEANKAPVSLLEHAKPWFAALTLSTLPLTRLGYDTASGVDRRIKARAREAGKTLVGLETSEEQIGFFDRLPRDLQIELLVQTIDEQATLSETIDKMMTAWTDGKPVELAATLNESMTESPELAKALLFDRNARWAGWIRDRLAKPGKVFLAVGAGHLAGPMSVQEALMAAGLKVRRISNR